MLHPMIENDEDLIREIAYQKFLERGASHGNDLDDWLAAEREFLGKDILGCPFCEYENHV